MNVRLLAVTLMIGQLSLSALAVPMNYSDPLPPSGAVIYTGISEDSATDAFPLYGSPSQIGNALSFSPTSFVSYSGPNSSDMTSGTLTFKVSAPVGGAFTKLTVREVGDYAITGLGQAQAYVSGLLTVLDLDSGALLFDSLTVVPSSPFLHPTNNDGVFSADVVLLFSGMNTKNIQVVFNNTLATSAEPLSAALVQKKAVDFAMSYHTPEPATLLLLGIGAIGAVARRTRRRSAAR